MSAWSELKSSNLEAYQHDPEMDVLHVRFRGGRTYSYRGVPAEVVAGFAAAESPGRYFREAIRDKFQPFW